VNFHIGGGRIGEQLASGGDMGWRANFARVSAMLFTDNLRCIGDLIHGGVCHRFPTLNFVSVESGVSMLPGALESFDWQWRNGGVAEEHPEYELLPSEYFRRQIHGCFWYERETITTPLLAYPDNMLYETDFPHPTCQHPGPRTPAVYPEQYASSALGALPDDILEKVLTTNAARLYGVRLAA
jgi:predicted TIM-barrel fold metal-dependent hydrolase